MKFSAAIVAAAAAAGVSAHAKGNLTYVTETVDVYTTYCPMATQITQGGKVYTVTEATTLTITDCPCTLVKPVYTKASVACSTCAGAPTAAPVVATPAAAAGVPSNGTVPASYGIGSGSGSSSGSGSGTGSGSAAAGTPGAATAGAAKVAAAGLAGLVGVAAFLL